MTKASNGGGARRYISKHREKMRQLGYTRVEILIPKRDVEHMRRLAEALREAFNEEADVL